MNYLNYNLNQPEFDHFNLVEKSKVQKLQQKQQQYFSPRQACQIVDIDQFQKMQDQFVTKQTGCSPKQSEMIENPQLCSSNFNQTPILVKSSLHTNQLKQVNLSVIDDEKSPACQLAQQCTTEYYQNDCCTNLPLDGQQKNASFDYLKQNQVLKRKLAHFIEKLARTELQYEQLLKQCEDDKKTAQLSNDSAGNVAAAQEYAQQINHLTQENRMLALTVQQKQRDYQDQLSALRDQNANLREQLFNKSVTINTSVSASQLKEKEDKIAALNEWVRILQKQVSEFQSEIQASKRERTQLTEENNRLSELLAAQQQKLRTKETEDSPIQESAEELPKEAEKEEETQQRAGIQVQNDAGMDALPEIQSNGPSLSPDVVEIMKKCEESLAFQFKDKMKRQKVEKCIQIEQLSTPLLLVQSSAVKIQLIELIDCYCRQLIMDFVGDNTIVDLSSSVVEQLNLTKTIGVKSVVCKQSTRVEQCGDVDIIFV